MAGSAVGVDFGTTNSAIAIVGDDGSSRLASFEIGGKSTEAFRSLLYFYRDDDGQGPLRSVAAQSLPTKQTLPNKQTRRFSA